jgi:cytosine/adenosine deaminase-related metal-dependent hydrolase
MVRVSALVHSLELLKRGVTAHVDHFRHGASPTVAGMNAVFGAYRDIGIRATVAPMYEDRPYVESLPIDMARLPEPIQRRFTSHAIPAPEAHFEMLGEVTAQWRGVEGRLDVMIGVDGPQRCTAHLLELTGEFARKHGMGNHTHMLEAKTQALVADRVGGSLVAWLDRFGLVTEASSFAHFVWANERDIALVAERGATPVHNPVSNLHLGSGVARVPYLLRQGIDVAIGTDGGAGHALNILEQAKFASLLSRMTEADPGQWVGASTAFRMATEHGAKMIGMRGQLGRIAPGMKADVALISGAGIDWSPRGDIFSHLVMYDTGRATRTVLVAGEVVLQDGVSTRIDEADLLSEARACAEAVMRDNAASVAQFDAERPAWTVPILEAISQPLDINRLMF